MVHSEIGHRILTRLAVELTEVALVESPPRQEGMTMVQILGPKKEQAEAKAEKKAKAPKPKDGEPTTAAAGARKGENES
jgi:translation initiation factor IF-3